MKSLVGYTGFVGSNIAASGNFDRLYNSQNIENAFGTAPDLLVYSGVRAEKFLANKNPENDLENIKNAFYNIERIQPKKLVLISTIDVYNDPVNVDEDSTVDITNLSPYGFNRFYLENLVRRSGIDYMIVRLPGLYGQNIKKNFIYDMIHVIPTMLSEIKYTELQMQNKEKIIRYYVNQKNGFFKCRPLEQAERIWLKGAFEQIGFSALNFTDSRGRFQFYNLKFLTHHIEAALKQAIPTLNLAVEPIEISELYKFVNGGTFTNYISDSVPNYNFITKYSESFGGKEGYIFKKEFTMEDIKSFVERFDV